MNSTANTSTTLLDWRMKNKLCAWSSQVAAGTGVAKRGALRSVPVSERTSTTYLRLTSKPRSVVAVAVAGSRSVIEGNTPLASALKAVAVTLCCVKQLQQWNSASVVECVTRNRIWNMHIAAVHTHWSACEFLHLHCTTHSVQTTVYKAVL
jgi:hypothetical protein